MPTFTKNIEYQNDYYSTEISVYDEFDEEFDIDATDFFEECDYGDIAEFLDLVASMSDLKGPLSEMGDDERRTLAAALNAYYTDNGEAPPDPEYPTPADPASAMTRDSVQTLPEQWIAEGTNWMQIKALLEALPSTRLAAFTAAWHALHPSTKSQLLDKILNGRPAPAPREPIDDALELLSDVDRNRLLGLPDSTLDHLRELLSEA